MKGICARCQLTAGPAIPGKTVFCKENLTGAVYFSFNQECSWLMMSPVTREAWELTAATLTTGMPAIEAVVNKNIKP
jgi:hypothetical protein